MFNKEKLTFNFWSEKWLGRFFILVIIYNLGFFVLAEVNLVAEEVKKINEPKTLIEATSTELLSTTSEPVDTKNSSNSVISENLLLLKRKCFVSNFKPVFEENRNQLRKIEIEYRKLRYFATSTAERIRLFREYKSKVKNLRQEFLLKAKEISENCQNNLDR